MKTFIEYLKNLSENAEKRNVLNQLIKLSWSRYNPETKDFLEKMSNKDADIKKLFDELSRPDHEEHDFLNKDDDIYHNIPDSNYGNEQI